MSKSDEHKVRVQRVQSDGVVLLTGASLRFRIARLKPGVMLVTGAGHARDAGDPDVEAAMLEEFTKEIERSGSITVFADTRATPRISPGSREQTTRWLRRYTNQIMTHVLVTSKLMEMALAVVGIAMRNHGLKVYSSPEQFVLAIRSVVPHFFTLPSPPSL